jgi:hypothetical protein
MMDIRDFGRDLIMTGDLDPVYVGLYDAKLPEPQLCRLLLAYLCFYHLGASAHLSEHTDIVYWNYMKTAAINDDYCPAPMGGRWPRGTERRHFRGLKCIEAMAWLAERYPAPESAIRTLTMLPTEKMIIGEISKWPMFGSWVGFKAADLIDRVYGKPIMFDSNLGLMYDSPRKALDLLSKTDEFIIVDRTPVALYNNLITYFSGGHRAPPDYGRRCNAQEVETILCKWGSMKSGHYWVGKDIKEVREALHNWGPTAERILSVMPEEIEQHDTSHK